MHWHCSHSSIRMSQKEMNCPVFVPPQIQSSLEDVRVPCLQGRNAGHKEICWIPTSSSDGAVLLSSKQSWITSRTLFIKSVEILRLGMTATQRRHGRNVVVVLISFDNHRKFSPSLHMRILWQIRCRGHRKLFGHRQLPSCARLDRVGGCP